MTDPVQSEQYRDSADEKGQQCIEKIIEDKKNGQIIPAREIEW